MEGLKRILLGDGRMVKGSVRMIFVAKEEGESGSFNAPSEVFSDQIFFRRGKFTDEGRETVYKETVELSDFTREDGDDVFKV